MQAPSGTVRPAGPTLSARGERTNVGGLVMTPDVDHLTRRRPPHHRPREGGARGTRARPLADTWAPRCASDGHATGTHWPNVALLGTELAHSARVRTIKHRRERWVPLDRPPRAALAAAKERLWRTYNQPLSRDPDFLALGRVARERLTGCCAPPLRMRPSFRVS